MISPSIVSYIRRSFRLLIAYRSHVEETYEYGSEPLHAA